MKNWNRSAWVSFASRSNSICSCANAKDWLTFPMATPAQLASNLTTENSRRLVLLGLIVPTSTRRSKNYRLTCFQQTLQAADDRRPTVVDSLKFCRIGLDVFRQQVFMDKPQFH